MAPAVSILQRERQRSDVAHRRPGCWNTAAWTQGPSMQGKALCCREPTAFAKIPWVHNGYLGILKWFYECGENGRKESWCPLRLPCNHSLRTCRGCWLHCQVQKNSWLINFLVNRPSISCDTVWCKSWHKTQTSWWEQRKCQRELWEDTLGGSSPSSSVVPAGNVMPGATAVFGDHEGSHHQVKFIMATLEEHRSSATSLGQQLSHFWINLIYLIWDNDYLYLCLVELGHNFIQCPLVPQWRSNA